jgi:serine/threonine protein kinase
MSHPEKLGPYIIDRVLGSGGMGTVYAGKEKGSDEEVAVKVLARVLGTNTSFRERFSAEVETLKKLEHPNIVRLYAYGEEDGFLFYSMELVEGGSLHDELQKVRKFDWRDVTDIAIQVCHALKHAHDHGVIHRDIKPANLMRTSDKQVKLSDFGIAKLFGGQNTMAGNVIGTADYMSPEQADGRPITNRSDLYSLGSVIYALLAKRPPFAGGSVPEVLHNLRYTMPTSIRRLAPEIPDELAEIIDKLLEKEPEDRFANAFVLSNRLRAMEHALSQPTQLVEEEEEEVPQDDGDLTRLAENDEQATSMTLDFDTNSDAPAPKDDAELTFPTPDSTRLDDAPKKETKPAPKEKSFKVVGEEERRQAQLGESKKSDDSTSIIAIALGLVIVIALAMSGWWYSQPKSADDLFVRISESVEAGDAAEVEAEIEQFLTSYADDTRADLVKQYRQVIQLDRFAQRMELRLKGLGRKEPLGAAQRAFLEALRHEDTDPEIATRKYQAIVDVFGGDESDENASTCVKMANRKLEILSPVVATSEKNLLAELKKRFELAIVAETDDPAKARRAYDGLVELYRDYPWAADIVERARVRLKLLGKP